MEYGVTFFEDDIFVDDDFFEVVHGRDFVHDIEHDFFEDGAESARAAFSADGFADDGELAVVSDVELDVFELEESDVLFEDAIFGFIDDVQEHVFGEVIEGDDDGDSTHEFGDETELNDILCRSLGEEFGLIGARFFNVIGGEAHASFADAFFDDIGEVIEGAGEDEEDVRGIDADEVLLTWSIFSCIWREGDISCFDHFEECLLNAFAADVTSAGATCSNFIDFVDADDASFGLFDVFVSGHPEGFDDIFDVFADVTCLCECRGIGDGKGDIDEFGDGLRDESFSAAGGADHEDIAF